MMMTKLEMEDINTNWAGIDIGSPSHFVGGQDADVYAKNLQAICSHLKEHNIHWVAMESAGTYWQSLRVCVYL